MVLVMFGQAMLRLCFIYATLATWLVILVYEAISVIVVRAPGDVILNNWQRRMLLEEQASLSIEHSRKTRELEAAREMQLAMLPARLPDHPSMDICFSMTTATEVGGDYYDWTEGPDGTLTFVIADAAGHGAQAGVLVAAIAKVADGQPCDIVRELHAAAASWSEGTTRDDDMTFLVLKWKTPPFSSLQPLPSATG